MIQLLRALEFSPEMPDSDDLRGRVDKALEYYYDLRTSVARIDERFARAEEHIAEKMTDIATNIQKITLVAGEIIDLRSAAIHTSDEIRALHDDTVRLRAEVSTMQYKMHGLHIGIRILGVVAAFLLTVSVPIVTSFIRKFFGLP